MKADRDYKEGNVSRKLLLDRYTEIQIGSYCERNITRLKKAYSHWLKGWLPRNRDIQVLDLGCGGGEFLSFLSDQGFKSLTGIDASAQQMERARINVPNARLINGDVAEIAHSAPETFGLITAFDLLEHLPKNDVLSLLASIYKRLLDNGILIVSVPNCDSPFGPGVRYGDITHETGFTERSLTACLKLVGFVNIEFRESVPVPHGLFSMLRAGAWQLLRLLPISWSLVETGSIGSGLVSRNIFARAVRGSLSDG